MIQPPFPSTIAPQLHHIVFLTTKNTVRKNQENDSQTGCRAWTMQCLGKGGGGGGGWHKASVMGGGGQPL